MQDFVKIRRRMSITVNLVYAFSSLLAISVVNSIHSQQYDVQNIRKHTIENVQKYHLCPGGLCVCEGAKVRCLGHNHHKLKYIPRLPRNTTSLYFGYNHLPVINSHTFHNISDLKLEKLSFSNNEVVSIASDAFVDLIYLKTLYLGLNRGVTISGLENAINSLNKNTIEFISLQQIGWTEIHQPIFNHLKDSGLVFIDLSLNELQILDFKIFSGLTNLLLLDLRHNRLLKVETNMMEKLEYLNLNYNRLLEIPTFCNISDKFQTSYLPAIRYLYLNFNQIDSLSEMSFKCTPLLKNLTLRGNPLLNVPDNFISSLYLLNYLDISNTTSNIYKSSFNSTSLTRLQFENMYCPHWLFCWDMFKYCANLTDLSLQHTQLPTATCMYSLLLPLTRIQRLDMSFTGLTYLPEDIFSKMRSLKYLDLSHNKISSWNGEQVFGNSNITTLLLNRNQISVINQTSIPPSVLNSLRYLDLSDNLFLCTCETRESANWFRRYAYKLNHYPNEYKCFGPDNLKGTLLQNYNPPPESCMETNIALLVSVPVSIIAIVTMSAIFLVYKCRWRLRYRVYLFMNRHKQYERIDGSDSFVYAGFVIYSDDDRNWVHNELLHRIEDHEGFRLCIRLRDFDVGKVHVDNIVDNMFLSEKIIVILSNNFAKDEWCHFQLLLAETRLLKQNTDMLVIIMLDEIRSDCLRQSLYKLVRDRQYAFWSTYGTGNNLFWEQAVSQMKKPTGIN